MGSTRVWIAATGVVVALLGAVGCSSGDGPAKKATPPSAGEATAPSTVAVALTAEPAATDTATATSPATTAPDAAPAASAPSTSATPSAEEIQALIAAMTVQLQQSASGGPETPAPTSEEIEAELLEQLRQLGIPL